MLGLERTGTLSMRAALLELGYYDVYHMVSCLFENPPDSDLWRDAIDAKASGTGKFTKENWDQLLGHCMVSPTCVVRMYDAIAEGLLTWLVGSHRPTLCNVR